MYRFFILLLLSLAVAKVSAGPIDQAAALEGLRNPEHLLIDVRTEKEFAAGHIEGATRIGHDTIANEISRVTTDKNKPIVLYCRSGQRSSRAQDDLQKAGYRNVINGGGYEDLQKAIRTPR